MLRRAKLREFRDFLGPRIVRLLFLGVLNGLALFAVEFAFAYALQAFLITLGVMSPTAKLPGWVPHSSSFAILGFVFGVGALRGILQWAQVYMQGAALEELKYQQRQRILRWAYSQESVSTTQVTSLYNERTNSAGIAALNLQNSVTVLSTGTLLLGALFWLAPGPTLLVCALLGLLALPLRLLDKGIQQAGQGINDEWDHTNRKFFTSIKNLLLMRIYGTEGVEEASAQKSLRAYTDHAVSYYRMLGMKFAIPQIIGVALVCVIVLSAQASESLSSGILVTYFYLFVRFVQNFAEGTKASANFMLYLPQLRELWSWWKKSASEVRTEALGANQSGGTIEPIPQPVGWKLSGVSFSYPGAKAEILKSLELTIRPGSTAVITGSSGAGKSTLLGLMLGGLRPDSGTVSLIEAENLDGVPLALQKPRLLKGVGYVGPESFLIEGSVYENLLYGLDWVPTSEEIHRALQQAECQFVFQMPEGLAHHITEQGQGLSAGQKQRLSLARALLRRPKVLVLDEATANLDAETESKLVETLARFRGQMTIVAVTHREALLKLADEQIRL